MFVCFWFYFRLNRFVSFFFFSIFLYLDYHPNSKFNHFAIFQLVLIQLYPFKVLDTPISWNYINFNEKKNCILAQADNYIYNFRNVKCFGNVSRFEWCVFWFISVCESIYVCIAFSEWMDELREACTSIRKIEWDYSFFLLFYLIFF